MTSTNNILFLPPILEHHHNVFVLQIKLELERATVNWECTPLKFWYQNRDTRHADAACDSGGLRSSSRRHARMLEEGVEGAGVQCVQRAYTCSAMNWCALLSAGAYGWLGVRPATRSESRASEGGAALFPCYPTAAAKNLSTNVVLQADASPKDSCKGLGSVTLKIKQSTHTVTVKVTTRVPPCDDVPACPCLFLLPPSSP